jgi:iron complex outermembrane receptor protein
MSHSQKNPRSPLSNAVRLALLCGAATSVGVFNNAFAADTDQNTNQQSTATLGKIEVTGSKIKRTDVETAQPVQVITAAQIKATGLATIGDILQKLTSSGAALNTLANDNGNFTFTGGGQTNVDLRYLGAQRVLVLVNGKRWVSGLDGTVDLNTIPTSVIDHIEVLQDGASAIYGSDAISGVVNIITLQNYNGREASAYVGIYNGDGHYDGKTQNYDITIGSSSDKSNLTFNVSYMKQDAISSADRRISQEPTFGAGLTRGSSATPQGRFVFIPPSLFPDGSNAANAPSPTSGFSSSLCPTTNFGSAATPDYQPLCDLTLKNGAAGTSPSDFRAFSSANDRFNFAPYNYVLTPEERFSTFLQGHTDLADNLTFKADAMYTHRDSQQQAGPEPLFFASTSIATNIPAGPSATNPFSFPLNTGAVQPAPQPNAGTPAAGYLGLLGRRMIEIGPRRYDENEDTFYFNGGFSGFFNAGASEWDWNAYYAFSKDTEIDTNQGHFDTSHLANALDPAKCAATLSCVPLNLFGGQGVNGTGSITPAMLAYSSYVGQNEFQNNQRIYSADISNSDLAELPGGPLGFAAGYQYIEHDGFFQPNPVAENGYDTFNPGRPVPPTTGRITEKSEFVEFDIPLVADVPAFKILDLDVARRHTSYSSYGGNDTNKAGLKWKPVDDVLVRGTWSQGFRAPNINELFEGATNLSAQATDPCSNYNGSGVSAAVIARCQAAGVPASYTQPNGQINTQEGGNPNLQPETSVSRTLGFVYSPDWLSGLNVSADYYRIELDNTIQPISGQVILDDCYVNGDPASCARIKRTASGGIASLNDAIANTGGTFTTGIDFSLSYAFPSTSIGDFKASMDSTYVKTFQQTTITGSGPITTDLAGIERGGSVFPFGIPHHKTRLAVNWNLGAWSAEWDVRYISGLTEKCSDSFDGGPNSLTNLGLCTHPSFYNNQFSTNHLGATTYHDAQVNWAVDSLDTTFTFGIRNLFAKNPPTSTQQQLNSFDPTLYDVPGRFLYLRAQVKF